MGDRYSCFEELKAKEHRSAYRVEASEIMSPAAVIAPHGGRIERGTSELVIAIAGSTMTRYLFEGRRKKRNRRLHITSHHFDEPKGLRIAKGTRFAVAVHGRKNRGDPKSVWIGGRDEGLGGCIADALREAGFTAIVGREFPGRHHRNICNLGTRGAGAQLELPRKLRDELRADLARRERFAAAVRSAIDEHSVRNA